MDLGLSGSVSVIVAASRGLGRACAQALAAEGSDLAICSRSAERITRVAAEIRSTTGREVLAEAVDVTRSAAIDGFASHVEAHYHRADILVVSGGGPRPGTFETLSDADFLAATDLMLMSVVRTVRAFLPLLRRSRGGRIILVTSTSVREVIANLMLSNALRAAVTGLSKTLARELASEQILVNCVAPGTIGTERIDELVAANARRDQRSEPEVREAMRQRIPLGRFGRPEEFASAVVFLASARASFITGTTLVVDGGQTATVT